jgi:hypothetical protein
MMEDMITTVRAGILVPQAWTSSTNVRGTGNMGMQYVRHGQLYPKRCLSAML